MGIFVTISANHASHLCALNQFTSVGWLVFYKHTVKQTIIRGFFRSTHFQENVAKGCFSWKFLCNILFRAKFFCYWLTEFSFQCAI